jgi:putative DNA primase/helicase
MKPLERYPWIAEDFDDVKEEQGGTYVSALCSLKCHRTARARFWCGADGTLLFTCFAGCCKLEMLRAVGRGWKDCYPECTDWHKVQRKETATYNFKDETGAILYRKVRLEPGFGGSDKTFVLQRRIGPNRWDKGLGDVRRVLYRLPELLAAPPGELVCVVAGEKDVDTLVRYGFVATTNVGGEREEWTPEYNQLFFGRDVLVIADNDATGIRHANEVCGALMLTARSVRRCTVPAPHKDVTDYATHLKANECSPELIAAHLGEYFSGQPAWMRC